MPPSNGGKFRVTSKTPGRWSEKSRILTVRQRSYLLGYQPDQENDHRCAQQQRAHVGEAVFVGDTLFMPDVGTARCDFPGGDARALYASTRKLLSLPPETRLFMCHDYPPNDRPVAFETTVAEQRAKNIHVHDGVSADEFVTMRTKRDATLEMPTLILPSVQVNIRAGELPPKEDNGVAYLKIPLNAL